MDSDSIPLLVIAACVVLSAYFSATETAFSSLNRIRIKGLAEKGNRRAKLVLRLSDNYDGLLSTILIGNNIVNIAAASLATVFFVRLLGAEAGPSVSTAVITIVVLVFGEISPKSIAKEMPEQFAMFSAPIINVLMVVLTPCNFIFRQWKKLLSRMFKVRADRSITEEELLTIVDEAEHDGGIGRDEGTLIRSAIEFSELEALDVLTPRIDITAVPIDASKEEIARVFAESEFSRLPVYKGGIDNIVGILYQKDFHNHIYHTGQSVEPFVRPALYVSAGKRIGDLLKELQQKKLHIAVVLDEFGGTVGIVTMEDILEELVGDIWDEHDDVVEEIRSVSDREYIVLGSASVQKLFERLGIDKELDVVTVSGWVMEEIGNVPEEGSAFVFHNYKIRVIAMDGNRVEKIRVIKQNPEAAGSERDALP